MGEPAAVPATGIVRRHRVLLTVGVVVVVLLAVAAWTGARLYATVRGLQDLVSVAEQAKAHAQEGDTEALVDDVSRADAAARRASDAAGDLTVRWAGHLPGVGDDVRALRETAVSAAELTRAATPLATLAPRLVPQDGRAYDVTVISNTQSALQNLAIVARATSARLSDAAGDGVDSRLRSKMDQVVSGLDDVGPAVTNLDPFLRVLPLLLGDGQDHTWFVTMQNLTEARPSGGLLSAYLVLQVKDGHLKVLHEGPNDDLVAGPGVPYQAMPAGLKELWGDSLASWASMNLSADFSDNATLIRDGWNARGEEQVDSVLALGQGTLPLLAAAVGPVTVDGKTIAPQDLEDYLTIGVYRDHADVAAKDAAVSSIITQVFDRLAAGKLDLASLVTTTAGYESGDYLQLWSSDQALQKQIVAQGMDGDLPTGLGPVASVRVVNAAGNKLDAFTQLTADYAPGACVVDDDADTATRETTFTTTLTNDAPTSGLPDYMVGRLDVDPSQPKPAVGSNRDLVLVYLPEGATMTSARQDGEDAFVQTAQIRGRTVLLYDVEADPGQTVRLVTRWQEPAVDDDGAALDSDPRVVTQPMLRVPTVTVEPVPGCSLKSGPRPVDGD